MKRDQVISLPRQHEPEFHDAGVGALFLFGSVTLDEAGDASDVDVFLDLARPDGFTLFDLVELQSRIQGILAGIQGILGARVDLMTRQGIHPRRRRRIELDAVRVF
jgi:predicted nucleotidyltransferase